MDAYKRWASSYITVLPALCYLLQAIPSLAIEHRKAVLTCARVQPTVITRSSRYYKEFCHSLTTSIIFRVFAYGRYTLEQQTLLALLQSILPTATPIVFALLSMAVRMAPYESYDSVQAVKEQTIQKEIVAGITPGQNADLNWQAVFSRDPRDRYLRLAPNLPLNPEVHRQIHARFMHARDLLHGTIVYPRTSSKTIGKEAEERVDWATLGWFSRSESRARIRTLEDLERHYHETGEWLQGPVEMRSAWKYNDLKPRVYYAQGPDTYPSSRFIQPVFNSILDCFECVHRKNRYSLPDDRPMTLSDVLLIYDYSSFTSNLEAIKDFTRQIADFFMGTKIVVIDTYRGPRVADLGFLMLEYTVQCNESSVFDAQRVLERDQPLLLAHTCGMLGVPGNISSCTLLHGLHLCILVESILRSRCIGDDAIVALRDGTIDGRVQEFQDGVQNLGVVAPEKVSSWLYEDDPEEAAWHYVKSPITRVSSAIQLGLSLVWPSIANTIPLDDDYHTTTTRPLFNRQKTFVAQWSRLLDRIRYLVPVLTEADIHVLVTFQNNAYRSFGFHKGGLYIDPTDRRRRLILPVRMTYDDFDTDWRRCTLDYLADKEAIELPSMWGVRREILGYVGEKVETISSALLGLLEKLGYLEKTISKEIVDFRTMSRDQALMYLDLSYPFTYEYVVVKDFPSWVQTVQYIEHMSPHERISNLEYTDR